MSDTLLSKTIASTATLKIANINSLDLFQRSDTVRNAFGAGFQELFSRLKQAERNNFERIVTPLDHLWYSRVA